MPFLDQLCKEKDFKEFQPDAESIAESAAFISQAEAVNIKPARMRS